MDNTQLFLFFSDQAFGGICHPVVGKTGVYNLFTSPLQISVQLDGCSNCRDRRPRRSETSFFAPCSRCFPTKNFHPYFCNFQPRGGETGVLWWCLAPTGVGFCCLGQVGNVATAIAHKTALACAMWANVFFALGANAVVFLVDLVLAIFAIHGLLLFVNCCPLFCLLCIYLYILY